MLIYPRPLYELPPTPEDDETPIAAMIRGLRDITHRLGDNLNKYMELKPPDAQGRSRIRMLHPDPADPSRNLPLEDMEGDWLPGNVTWQMPSGFTSGWGHLLNDLGFTVWQASLTQPIDPGSAQWFWWQMRVTGAGDVLPKSMFGSVAYHQFASPIDVRRTLEESLRSAVAVSSFPDQDAPDEIRPGFYRDIIAKMQDTFGFYQTLMPDQPRGVDNIFYHLSLETGKPNRQFPIYVDVQGDIRPYAESPRVGRSPMWDHGHLDEPVFDWKWGSALLPPHPWQGHGFSIRIGLASKRKLSHHRVSEAFW